MRVERSKKGRAAVETTLAKAQRGCVPSGGLATILQFGIGDPTQTPTPGGATKQSWQRPIPDDQGRPNRHAPIGGLRSA